MMSDQINPPAEPEADSSPANPTNDVTQPAEQMPEASVTVPEISSEPAAPMTDQPVMADPDPDAGQEEAQAVVPGEIPPTAAADNNSKYVEEEAPEAEVVTSEASAVEETPDIEKAEESQPPTTAETETAYAEEPESGEADPPAATKQAQKPQPKRKVASARDIREITEAFVACVRCGYFLSAYRMLFGEQHFSEVVGEREDDWLQMSWSHEMRKTVEKSFGIRIDNNIEYYQGCCEMCRRNFVFSMMDEQEATMRIQIRKLPPQPYQSRKRR